MNLSIRGINHPPYFFLYYDMLDTLLDTLYDKVMERPNKILNIFNNFFGEERVDMQEFPTKESFVEDVLNMDSCDILRISGIDAQLKDIPVNTEEADTLVEALSSEKILSLLSEQFNCIGFILVHFPETTVTNEFNRHTVVKHIYIKVPITSKGCLENVFTMNRSEYTVAELASDYMHSHTIHIPFEQFCDFQRCCLGSGPIRDTQMRLMSIYDEDIWYLFCLELSKFVEVESIEGVPYHRLENISLNKTELTDIDNIATNYTFHSVHTKSKLEEPIKRFFSYYLDNNSLKFSFRNGIYSIGVPYIEYLINISNSFIEWVNAQPNLAPLKNYLIQILKDCILEGRSLYIIEALDSSSLERYRSYIGERVCIFKGKTVTLTITDIDTINESSTGNNVKVIDPALASVFLNRILTIINYRYGRTQTNSNYAVNKIRHKI